MEPTEARPYVLRILDLGFQERVTSAHPTLAEAQAAGEDAKRRTPTLQRRYRIVSLNGERWELVGGEWRKD